LLTRRRHLCSKQPLVESRQVAVVSQRARGSSACDLIADVSCSYGFLVQPEDANGKDEKACNAIRSRTEMAYQDWNTHERN
jgi:hypothetical protein